MSEVKIFNRKTGEIRCVQAKAGAVIPCERSETVIDYGVDMTLRDYFAAQALQGFCTNSFTNGERLPFHQDYLADAAYAVADAMMEEREKRSL